ncbi:putative cell wall-binding protein [Streptacidiphilus sp. MAP12-33]|uniref:TolB family protein n=1 Tax=Streptacidiphilus sp. MAP12-33 TaxID=3156266 RepID=UPI003511B9F8
MSHHSRRSLTALTSAVAVAAVAVGFLGTGTAQAASAGPADGVIAYEAPNGSVHYVNADGTGDRVAAGVQSPGSGRISWAADGSRIAVSGSGTVFTAKFDGSAPLNVSSGRQVSTQDGVYGGASTWMVSDDGAHIYRQTSDGWSWAQRVLPAADEPASVADTHAVYSWRGLFAFTRAWGGSTSVMTYDPATKRLNEVAKVAANPAFSADGSTIVYEQNQGGVSQIGAVNPDGSHGRTLTSDPAGAHNPSLSPDGTKLAYTSYDSTRGNVVKLLDLTKGTTTVLADGEMPVWQPLRKAVVDHVYGTGGVSNDAAASRWQFDSLGHNTPGLLAARTAVLADRNDTTDAVLGIELAAEKQGPLLLTSRGSLDKAAADDLRRTLKRGATVYLEGGTSVLTSSVATQVQRLGYRVARIASAGGAAGQSVGTAWNVAHVPTQVVVADAQDYRVAASAATMAASAGGGGRTVVLLNTGYSLPSSLTAFFNGLNPKSTAVTVVGNRSIYAMEHSRTRQAWQFWIVPGADAEYLSVNMAKFWWGAPAVTTLANTSDWRSGFAGGSVNAGYGPLLWTSATGLDPVDHSYIAQEAASVGNVQLFGTGWPMATVNGIDAALASTPSWAQLVQNPNGTSPASAAAHAATGAGTPTLVAGAGTHTVVTGTTLH